MANLKIETTIVDVYVLFCTYLFSFVHGLPHINKINSKLLVKFRYIRAYEYYLPKTFKKYLKTCVIYGPK